MKWNKESKKKIYLLEKINVIIFHHNGGQSLEF